MAASYGIWLALGLCTLTAIALVWAWSRGIGWFFIMDVATLLLTSAAWRWGSAGLYHMVDPTFDALAAFDSMPVWAMMGGLAVLGFGNAFSMLWVTSWFNYNPAEVAQAAQATPAGGNAAPQAQPTYAAAPAANAAPGFVGNGKGGSPPPASQRLRYNAAEFPIVQ